MKIENNEEKNIIIKGGEKVKEFLVSNYDIKLLQNFLRRTIQVKGNNSEEALKVQGLIKKMEDLQKYQTQKIR